MQVLHEANHTQILRHVDLSIVSVYLVVVHFTSFGVCSKKILLPWMYWYLENSSGNLHRTYDGAEVSK